MGSTLISEWQELRRGRPGRRFQDGYEASRRTKNRVTLLGRIVRIGMAVVALVVGIILVFIPGPAILFFAIAGGLLAAESRQLARLLDWTEVQIRKVAIYLRRRWRKLSLGGKIVVGVAVVAMSVVGLLLIYRLM